MLCYYVNTVGRNEEEIKKYINSSPTNGRFKQHRNTGEQGDSCYNCQSVRSFKNHYIACQINKDDTCSKTLIILNIPRACTSSSNDAARLQGGSRSSPACWNVRRKSGVYGVVPAKLSPSANSIVFIGYSRDTCKNIWIYSPIKSISI